jgi:hypothetical protein
MRAFMYRSCSIIQENVISDRADDQFSLEILTLMEDIILDIGILERERESYFLVRASARVARPRRSSDEAQHNQSHEAQPDSTRYYAAHSRNEKLHKRPRSFLLQTILISSVPHDQSVVHRFLCSPALRKYWDEISFKGEGL